MRSRSCSGGGSAGGGSAGSGGASSSSSSSSSNSNSNSTSSPPYQLCWLEFPLPEFGGEGIAYKPTSTSQLPPKLNAFFNCSN